MTRRRLTRWESGMAALRLQSVVEQAPAESQKQTFEQTGESARSRPEQDAQHLECRASPDAFNVCSEVRITRHVGGQRLAQHVCHYDVGDSEASCRYSRPRNTASMAQPFAYQSASPLSGSLDRPRKTPDLRMGYSLRDNRMPLARRPILASDHAPALRKRLELL